MKYIKIWYKIDIYIYKYKYEYMWEICDLDDLSGNWHEVLFGGAAGVGAVGGGSDQSAAVGVPRVAARGPRQLAAERRHEVINGPADDGVVVHAHVHVDYANGITHTLDFQWVTVNLIQRHSFNTETIRVEQSSAQLCLAWMSEAELKNWRDYIC